MLLQCAEEGYLLQPKHHAADWSMPVKKEAKVGKEQQQGSTMTTSDLDVPRQKDDRGGAGGVGGGDGTGGDGDSVTPSLTNSSSGQQQQSLEGQKQKQKQGQEHGLGRGHPQPASPPRKKQAFPSPRPPPASSHREKMLTDMKKLKEKRLKVCTCMPHLTSELIDYNHPHLLFYATSQLVCGCVLIVYGVCMVNMCLLHGLYVFVVVFVPPPSRSSWPTRNPASTAPLCPRAGCV